MFALAIVVIVIVSLLKADYFHPSIIYFLVQMVMLGVSYLQLVPAMTDFKFNTWLVWSGGMIAFIGGSILTELVWATKNGPRLPAKIQLQAEYNWECHFLISFLAFAYFLIGVFGVISVAGNLIIFTGRTSYWLSKDSPALVFADYFTSGSMVVGLFAVASFKSMNPVRWIRNVSKCMVLFTIVLSFMTFPSRGVNLLCLGFFLLLCNFLHGRFSWKSLLIVGIFVLGFFVAVASMKGQYGETLSGGMNDKIIEKAALLPYSYVANNYWNLDYAFNRLSDIPEHKWTYGIDAFYGITHLLRIGDGLQESFHWDTPFNESVNKVENLNTIPYLWDAYKDFGLPGLFLVPFFFGIFFTWVYRRMSYAKTPFGILCMCTFTMWILLWNFTTGYKQSMYWVWIGFFFIVCSVSSGKGALPAKLVSSDEVSKKKDGDNQVPGQGE